MSYCNIVELIENNPITKLSNTYNNKLLNKIKQKFTETEQKLFITSFYCYLNYNKKDDFVIDLDNVWRWLGFSQKVRAKELLIKHFCVDKDYKILLSLEGKQTIHIKGGHNKEIIMLNIDTFKRFCLKAGTKKADEIHEYFIKLEETMEELILEESNELKLQLENTKQELQNKYLNTELIREKTLLEQFPNNTQCVYYGIIDNLSDNNEKLIKFGNSNNLINRIKKHKETYKNFRLVNAFKVDNKLQIENAIKNNKVFNERQRTITIKQKKYIELLNIEGITFSELDKIIKEIIESIEYSKEKYIKLLEENIILKKQLEEKNKNDNNVKLLFLEEENKHLKIKNIRLIKKYNSLRKKMDISYNSVEELSEKNILENEVIKITQEDIDNHGLIMKTLDTEYIKNKDGTYTSNGKIFTKLYGTREQVWNGHAYKTTGHLTKQDLMINNNGKIVSIKKSIHEKLDNKLEKYGVNKPKIPQSLTTDLVN